MKIDIVSENASPIFCSARRNPGAQAWHVRELATALARWDHEVTVWTRRDAVDQPEVARLAESAEIRYVAAGPPRRLSERELVPHLPELAEALRAAWSRRRPDVVHTHCWTSGLAASAAARDVHTPTVQTFHSLADRRLSETNGSPAGRIRVEQVLSRSAAGLIATSTEQAGELVRLGAARRTINVIPHGIDTALFDPAGPALPRADRPRVVHVGRLEPRRGADEAVAALAAVPHAELVVAGDFGPRGRDRARLRALADRYGVADRLRWIEPMPRGRVPQLLRSADVVVSVPWFGRFGMVALEAMACGRPVVASAVGGLADTVVDGVTGAHVAPRRPRELASTLRSVLGSPTMVQAFGVAGRDRAVSRYSWTRIADSTAEVYRRVAGL